MGFKIKYIVSAIFILLSLGCFSQNVWYVKPDGDNTKDGTSEANAWKTWGKALNSGFVQPGDTVYFLDGEYTKDLTDSTGWYSTNGYEINIDGTQSDTVYFFAADGATPVLDCSGVGSTSDLNYGIRAGSVNYCYFYGLQLKNVWTGDSNDEALGWSMSGDGIVVENCKVYNTHGFGFRLNADSNDTIHVINCDAYNCSDSLKAVGPGNDGYGFGIWNGGNENSVVYLTNCRAWLCGDDGFAFYNNGKIVVSGCWSFNNGQLEGAGNGFKLGFIPGGTYADTLRHVSECIAAGNDCSGFNLNDNSYDAIRGYYVNNLSYRNGYSEEYPYSAVGYRVYNTSSSDAEENKRVFKNNVSYANEDGDIAVSANALYTHEYNSWDDPPDITVASGDFIDLPADSAAIMTLMSAARDSDGSLPDLGDYFKPSSESQLIDAGTDVGYGDDIGAFQYEAQNPAVNPTVVTGQIYNISKTGARVIGNTTDDGGGDVSQKGVCWSESENPDTGDNKTEEGAGAGTFNSVITGLTENTTYHVRAYATNEAGTAYGADQEFKTLKSGYVSNLSNIIWHNGKIIYY